MTGDGGFFLNIGELWTAVQEKLDLTVIVMNDRGYGVIKRIQDATAQGRRFFADLQGPDLGAGGTRRHSVLEGRARRGVRRDGRQRRWRTTGSSLVEVDMTRSASSPPTIRSTERPAA